MPAQIIDGEAVAGRTREDVKVEVAKLGAGGTRVTLAAVQANDNAGSRIYVASQRKTCEEVGIDYRLVEMDPASGAPAIKAKIDDLNADASVHGIILQMPVPEGVDAAALQQRIAPGKDVEGMVTANQGRVVYGDATLAPCTAKGILLLAKSLELAPSCDPLPGFAKKMIEAGKTTAALYGKNVCVVGHSEIVGKPAALLFLDHFCTVTVCHVGTPPETLKRHTLEADILVVATGVPQARWNGYRRALAAHEKDPSKPRPEVPQFPLITADMIRPGAAVLDAGINRIGAFDADGNRKLNKKGKGRTRTVGNVDFKAAQEVAGFITPVPGGVGPMTVAMLLQNTVEAARATTT